MKRLITIRQPSIWQATVYLFRITAFCLLGYIGAYIYSTLYLKPAKLSPTTIKFIYADEVDRVPFIEVNSPFSKIKVEVVTRQRKNKFLHSYAHYKLSDENAMSTKTTAPLFGSYTGVQASGLFWSRNSKSWNIKLILRFASLNLGERFIVVTDTNGKLLATKRARFPKIKHYPVRQTISVNGQGFSVYKPQNTVKKRPPIVLVSGSNNSTLYWEANYFASKGFPVLTILPNPHLGLDCLYKLDPQRMTPAITKFVKSLDYQPDKIIMIGISAGGTASLLYETDEKLPAIERFILSPIPLHLNGGKGPKCSIPSPYWKGLKKYENFFSNDLAGWKDLALFKIGLINQRTVIENMISKKTKAEIDEISLMQKIPNNTHIFLGEDDGILPSYFTYTNTCKSSDLNISTCMMFKDAGHNLLYSGHTAMGCSSYKKNCSKNQSATYEAQKVIIENFYVAIAND